MKVLPGRPISFHRGITVVRRPVKAGGRGANPRDGAMESRPIQAGGTRPENEVRHLRRREHYPRTPPFFPSVAQARSSRSITGRPRSAIVRKDGSKALGGERLSEAQKGTVQLRREPPDFVPVVKQIIIRPREGRVPSAILGGNTSFSQWDICRCGRKVMHAFCKRAQAGALPAAGPSLYGGAVVRAAFDPVKVAERVQVPCASPMTATPKSPRRQVATLLLPGASPGAVSNYAPGKRR